MPSPEHVRALTELTPTRRTVLALEIRHPDVATPIRVVRDTESIVIERHTYAPVAFRARLAADVDGRAPTAELSLDNIGRVLMRWVDAAQGGAGATVRVMQALMAEAGGSGEVEWEITTDVLSVSVDQREVVVRLGYDPMLSRPAVLLRYDPTTAPGLF